MEKKRVISNKDGIPYTNFFVYKSQNYPIKFDFFKYSSKYFLTNKKKLKQIKYIQFVEEETESKSDFQSEWIKDFINFVQCENITLDDANVLCLNYLANVYEVESLHNITDEYISTNEENLVVKIIHQHQNESNFDISKYEEMISNKFTNFIENDELLMLNISILQRIISKFANKNIELKEEQINKILDFLMKCLDKYGSNASVLFNEVEIVKSSKVYLDQFMRNYSNIFDFNFLDKMIL